MHNRIMLPEVAFGSLQRHDRRFQGLQWQLQQKDRLFTALKADSATLGTQVKDTSKKVATTVEVCA